MMGIDEGQYKGTILMDDSTLVDTHLMDDAFNTSPYVASVTIDLSTPSAD